MFQYDHIPRHLLFGFSILLICSGWIETTKSLNQKGNKEFQAKRYESALEAYRRAQVKKPDQPDIRYNLGTTLYQVDQFQDAQKQLAQALTLAKAKALKAEAWYNLGNADYRLGKFDEAIRAYRNALEINPNDRDAKYNLELLQKKKNLFEQKQKQRDKENKEKPQQSRQNREQERQRDQADGRAEEEEERHGAGTGDQKEDKGEDQREGEEQGTGPSGEEMDEDAPMAPGQKGNEEQLGEQNETQAPLISGEVHPVGEKSQLPEEAPPKEPTRPLYQGQMSRADAIRLLDALRATEQELQVLRRPTPQAREHEPLKDW